MVPGFYVSVCFLVIVILPRAATLHTIECYPGGAYQNFERNMSEYTCWMIDYYTNPYVRTYHMSDYTIYTGIPYLGKAPPTHLFRLCIDGPPDGGKRCCCAMLQPLHAWVRLYIKFSPRKSRVRVGKQHVCGWHTVH